jgi:arylformamidase
MEVQALRKGRIVDLSHRLRAGKERFKLEIDTFFVDEYLPGFKRIQDDWYVMQEIHMCSHVGTHIEAPLHHLKEGRDAAGISLERLIGEAIVLDFSYKKANESIEVQELEKVGQNVREGDIVLIRTGLSKFYNTPNYRRPYLAKEAVKWLVDRRVSCIGVDCSGIEKLDEEGQPNHRIIFGNDIPLIEDLNNLEQLRQERVFLIVLPLKIEGLDASPVRVIAIEGIED